MSLKGEAPAQTAVSTTSVALSQGEHQSRDRRAQDALKDGPQAILPVDAQMSDTEDIGIAAEQLIADKEDFPHDKPTPISNDAREFIGADVWCDEKKENITRNVTPKWPHNLVWGSSDGHYLDVTSQDIFPTHSLSGFPPKSDDPLPGFHSQRPTTTGVISPEVVYCHYPTLTITNIHRIPQEDFSFLELQGCLKVPIRPLLDEFVQQYFLHVHPILPVVHEGDFWDLYDNKSSHSPKEPIALLLFQAMLFAASTFVSQSIVRALGYSDLRSMRAKLLRRTKLLYDFESESSPFIIAQTSVLLSTASLSSSGQLNTIWLSLAIENAKLAEAHLYTNMASASCSKQRNALKRLWWCCIIRDRSMGLLLKRPVQITKEQFNLSDGPLNSNDLKDELLQSKVYCPSTKWKLAEILSQSVLLFIKLTDVLMLLYPPNGNQQFTKQGHDDALLQLYECKSGLREWHLVAASKLRNFHSHAELETLPKTEHSSGHDSVTLYTNLMYMYYHTARIVLCHHEALHLGIGGTDMASPLAKDQSRISEMRRELQDAISDVNECHKELLRLELTQWMPHSAMGFSTLPLILNILDKKLSLPGIEGIHQSSTATQHQLDVLVEFMRAYWARFDGVDWITAIVRHIINLAQLNGSRSQRESTSINWADLFAFQPRSYLRLVLVLDLSLSKGRLAQDADFPVRLRGMFSFNQSPLKELSEGRPSLESRNPDFQWASQASPFDSVLRNRTQLHALEIDDCLINTLENEIAFHQLTDSDPFQHQEGKRASAKRLSLNQPITSLWNKSERLNSVIENSESPIAKREENVVSKDCHGSDSQANSGPELEGTADEEVVDGLLEAILCESLYENV
ncbi:Leucine--tRNA ligase [Fusarium falciforme]|uniref:Leucine--tRNA ligase n=1 Tax=Fusarium falciforme TaxID=195108 RepID=UPI002300BE59|nr:Leucine--tRNA ligase [Fusarium falciforme]WAO94458.1 Leucine--tRNA ligase [Fusarium falciforme]